MDAAWIGLGKMGAAMARRLADVGVELTVWNRSGAKAEAFARETGAAVAATPAEAARAAPVVFVNLRDSAAVEEVLGERGLAGSVDGRLVVDTTSHHFAAVPGIAARVRGAGGDYLELPVVGTVTPALRGQLTAFASGGRAGLERARPYVDALAPTVLYLGDEVGLATRLKLINNVVLASFMATLSEAIACAEAVGLSRERAIEVLGAGAGRSLVLEAKKGKLLAEDYTPQFSVELLLKDLHNARDLARVLRRPFHAATVSELYATAYAAGRAEEDFAVIFALLGAGGGGSATPAD